MVFGFDQIFFGFSVLDYLFYGFAVSNRPQCPPHEGCKRPVEKDKRIGKYTFIVSLLSQVTLIII